MMVYDSANQMVVLHGGYDGSTRPGDTWEWDGTNWTQTVAAGVYFVRIDSDGAQEVRPLIVAR